MLYVTYWQNVRRCNNTLHSSGLLLVNHIHRPEFGAMDVKDRQLPLFHLHSQSNLNPGLYGSGPAGHWKWRSARGISLTVMGIMMIVSASYFQYGRWQSCHSPSLVLQTGDGLPTEAFQQTWAQYSPYFPAAEYRPPPDQCIITQVRSAYQSTFRDD